ncbi:MAG: glycosyltransferase family 39 protein, partial [Flavobacteriales bacterium]|nr:glycosyltransferase family 39 protein [Flavobacteriales bacterium]
MIEKLKQLSSKVSVFNILILTYVFVNLLQAIFTPIHDDEAYYWIWSQSMDWGYFDHPPAIALIVKIGTLIFGDTTLGVRFVTVLLSGLTIFFSWKLTSEDIRNKQNSFLIFFALLISIPGFEMYGFITTPDVPLLFSFSLYLLAFRKLIDKQTVQNSLLWALTAAMLIYSKYHGGLIILVSVIVQPKLLKQWTTYLAGFVALLLIAPHIYWQYNHDFISIEYHLFQRTSGGFDISHPLEYIGNTIGILNPA